MAIFGRPTEKRFPKQKESVSPGPGYQLPSTLSRRGPKVQKDLLDVGPVSSETLSAGHNGVYRSNRESWIHGTRSLAGVYSSGKRTNTEGPAPGKYAPSVKLTKQRPPVASAAIKEKRFLRARVRYVGKGYEHVMKLAGCADVPGPGTYETNDPTAPRVAGRQFGQGTVFDAGSSVQICGRTQLSTNATARDSWVKGFETNSGIYGLRDESAEVGPGGLNITEALRKTQGANTAPRIPVPKESIEMHRFGSKNRYMDREHEYLLLGQVSPGPIYNPQPPPPKGGVVAVSREKVHQHEVYVAAIQAAKQPTGEKPALDRTSRYYKFVNDPRTPGPGAYEPNQAALLSARSHFKANFTPPPTAFAQNNGRGLRGGTAPPAAGLSQRRLVERGTTSTQMLAADGAPSPRAAQGAAGGAVGEAAPRREAGAGAGPPPSAAAAAGSSGPRAAAAARLAELAAARRADRAARRALYLAARPEDRLGPNLAPRCHPDRPCGARPPGRAAGGAAAAAAEGDGAGRAGVAGRAARLEAEEAAGGPLPWGRGSGASERGAGTTGGPSGLPASPIVPRLKGSCGRAVGQGGKEGEPGSPQKHIEGLLANLQSQFDGVSAQYEELKNASRTVEEQVVGGDKGGGLNSSNYCSEEDEGARKEERDGTPIGQPRCASSAEEDSTSAFREIGVLKDVGGKDGGSVRPASSTPGTIPGQRAKFG